MEIIFKLHDVDERIKPIQKKLKAAELYTGNIDGNYGSGTEKAVRKFQNINYLPPTGGVDSDTLYRLGLTMDDLRNFVASGSSAGGSVSGVGGGSASGAGGAFDSMTGSNYTVADGYEGIVKTNGALVFTGEYTLNEIQNKLDAAYRKAPDVIRTRAAKVRSIADSSMIKMKEMYILHNGVVIGKKTSDKETEVTEPKAKASTPLAGSKEVRKPNTDRWPRIIERGDSGDFVAQLQQLLIDLGYSCGPKKADGHFGSDTESAVRSFQSKKKIKVDGKVGPQTRKTLADA